MFILLKSATSGDNKTWNISISTDANQMKLVSPPFSGMRNSFLLLLVQTFTTRRHYKQLDTILTLTKFLDKKLVASWFVPSFCIISICSDC